MFKATELIISADTVTDTLTWTIPPDGTHLMIMINAGSERSAAVSGLQMRFNGDTGGNYGYQADLGNHETPTSTQAQAQTSMFLSSLAGDDNPLSSTNTVIVFVPSYNNDVLEKMPIMLAGKSASDGSVSSVLMGMNYWNDTSAIRTITLFDENSEDWVVGSVFSLHVIP